MARGTPSSQGRAARSEGGFSFQGPAGQAGASFMKSQRNEVGLIRNGEIKEATLVAVSNALNEIADNLLPTKPTTLVDLYDNQTRAYDRLLSVKNDEVVGSKGVKKQLKELTYATDKDERIGEGIGYLQENYGRGERIVVRLANELMMKAFVQGQRSFSGFAQLSISDLTPRFGAEVATKLVDLALREGYERMKRAGMTWQEEDPRGQLSGRAARSEKDFFPTTILPNGDMGLDLNNMSNKQLKSAYKQFKTPDPLGDTERRSSDKREFNRITKEMEDRGL